MAQLLSQVAVGTVVKINENGSPVNYIVVHQGLPGDMYDASCDGTWVLRQDIAENQAWDSGNSNVLESSDIQSYLNGTWINRYDTDIRNAIKTVKIPYCVGNGSATVNSGANGLECKVFLLSGYELGWTTSDTQFLPVDGAKLDYFDAGTGTTANNKRIAKLNGSATSWWLRSPRTNNSDYTWFVNTVGVYSSNSCSYSYGIRPALVLPSNLLVSDDGSVLTSPNPPTTLTVPAQAMQSQPIAVSWPAVEGADGYILERSADSGAWAQVYSGANTSYTDTAGAWTTVQYRVKAGLDGNYGEYTTSASVPVASASALTISGADGSLGTLTADVEFSVNTNTGNQIDLSYTVNGAQWYAGQVSGGYVGTIPVMELPTGNGTIVVTASVQATADKVTVTRTWTYNKTAAAFPAAGAVSQLSLGGVHQLPLTIAEAVRTNPFWGGDLGKALAMLTNSVQFYPNQTPKYQEVTVDLSAVSVGDTVQLPEDGVLADYLVAHIGNPDAALYDASCDGVWLLRKDIVEEGAWNSSNENTLPNSTIMQTMAGYLNKFPGDVQTAIKTVKIPYCVGNMSETVNSGADGLECKVFPLGGYEVGFTASDEQYLPADGAKLDYFVSGDDIAAQQRRIANLGGTATLWWLRSPSTTFGNGVYFVAKTGSNSFWNANSRYGIRPAFIMPTTFTSTYYVDNSGTVHNAQEYTQGGETTDVQGNPINIGAKISTGSYVGTGTYGEDNPNSLTFEFEPKLVIVISANSALDEMGTFVYNAPYGFSIYAFDQNRPYTVNLIWEEYSLKFYSTVNGDRQLNASGMVYYYVAFG